MLFHKWTEKNKNNQMLHLTLKHTHEGIGSQSSEVVFKDVNGDFSGAHLHNLVCVTQNRATLHQVPIGSMRHSSNKIKRF